MKSSGFTSKGEEEAEGRERPSRTREELEAIYGPAGIMREVWNAKKGTGGSRGGAERGGRPPGGRGGEEGATNRPGLYCGLPRGGGRGFGRSMGIFQTGGGDH